MEFTGTKEEIAKHYGISYKMLLDYLNLEMSLDGIIKRLLKRKELKQQAIKLEKEETSTEQIK